MVKSLAMEGRMPVMVGSVYHPAAGLEWRASHFASIAGLDRFREEMTREIQLVDRRAMLRAWLGLRPWPALPRIQMGLDWRWREGRAGDLREDYLDRRITGGLSYLF
jgi:hypothetical protein